MHSRLWRMLVLWFCVFVLATIAFFVIRAILRFSFSTFDSTVLAAAVALGSTVGTALYHLRLIKRSMK